MADGYRKPAMSLNQLHSRYLVDLSASQPNKPKPKPVDDVIQSTVKPNERFDDVPRFDFGTPSPPVQVNDEEPVSKMKESSPCLYGGFSDFDSPSSVLGHVCCWNRHNIHIHRVDVIRAHKAPWQN